MYIYIFILNFMRKNLYSGITKFQVKDSYCNPKVLYSYIYIYIYIIQGHRIRKNSFYNVSKEKKNCFFFLYQIAPFKKTGKVQDRCNLNTVQLQITVILSYKKKLTLKHRKRLRNCSRSYKNNFLHFM